MIMNLEFSKMFDFDHFISPGKKKLVLLELIKYKLIFIKYKQK